MFLDLSLPPKISTSFSSEESSGQWTFYPSSLESFFGRLYFFE
jgi:hypothetical protein